jgi:transcription elongation factor Elf1
MRILYACRCVRCGTAQSIAIGADIDATRFLMTYSCESCGKRQVRLDVPDAPETKPAPPDDAA